MAQFQRSAPTAQKTVGDQMALQQFKNVSSAKTGWDTLASWFYDTGMEDYKREIVDKYKQKSEQREEEAEIRKEDRKMGILSDETNPLGKKHSLEMDKLQAEIDKAKRAPAFKLSKDQELELEHLYDLLSGYEPGSPEYKKTYAKILGIVNRARGGGGTGVLTPEQQKQMREYEARQNAKNPENLVDVPGVKRGAGSGGEGPGGRWTGKEYPKEDYTLSGKMIHTIPEDVDVGIAP